MLVFSNISTIVWTILFRFGKFYLWYRDADSVVTVLSLFYPIVSRMAIEQIFSTTKMYASNICAIFSICLDWKNKNDSFIFLELARALKKKYHLWSLGIFNNGFHFQNWVLCGKIAFFQFVQYKQNENLHESQWRTFYLLNIFVHMLVFYKCGLMIYKIHILLNNKCFDESVHYPATCK